MHGFVVLLKSHDSYSPFDYRRIPLPGLINLQACKRGLCAWMWQ
jgi:hypothetical protein